MPVSASKIAQGTDMKYCIIQIWTALLSNSVYIFICLRKLSFTFGKEYCSLEIILKCFLWRSKGEGKERKMSYVVVCVSSSHNQGFTVPHQDKLAAPNPRCLWLVHVNIIRLDFATPMEKIFTFLQEDSNQNWYTLFQDIKKKKKSEMQLSFFLFSQSPLKRWKQKERRNVIFERYLILAACLSE